MAGDVRVYSSVPSVDLFVELGPSLLGGSPIVIDDTTRNLYAYLSGGVTQVGGGSSLPTLAAVATSGAYGDLSGTPTITTVAHGTITPTIYNVSGINTGVVFPCQYMQVGPIVTFSGAVGIRTNLGSGGIAEVGVSIPVASAFSAASQAGGGGAEYTSTLAPTTAQRALHITALVSATGVLSIKVVAVASTTMLNCSFNSTYLIV